MKSKKMTKSTFAIIIMAIVMVAMLAFGGTYAYFTATTAQQSKSVVTGTVMLNNSEFKLVADSVKVVPGMELMPAAEEGEKNVIAVTNKSDVATYIFVTITLVAEKYDEGQGKYVTFNTWDYEEAYKTATAEAQRAPWTVTNGDDMAKFQDVTAAVEVTTAGTKVYAYEAQAATDAEKGDVLELIAGIQLNKDLKSNSADNDIGSLMGIRITVTVDARSIQTEGFEGATAVTDAYNAVKDRANAKV